MSSLPPEFTFTYGPTGNYNRNRPRQKRASAFLKQGGLDTSMCIAYGGGGSTDVAFILSLALRAAYANDAGLTSQVGAVLGSVGTVAITSPSALVPKILRFTPAGGGALYAIAGTTTLAQWVTQLSQLDQVATAGVGGRVFEAFATIAENGYAALRADLASFGAGAPALLLGHSLGGALAELWGRKLRAIDGLNVRGVMTFGAPRVGNVDFSGAPGFDVYRFVHPPDPVPEIPPPVFARRPSGVLGASGLVKPAKYRHTAAFWKSVTAERIDVGNEDPGAVGDSLGAVTGALTGASGGFSAHPIKAYAEALAEWTGHIETVLSPTAQAAVFAAHAALIAAGN